MLQHRLIACKFPFENIESKRYKIYLTLKIYVMLSRSLVYSRLLSPYCVYARDKSVNSRESLGHNLGATLRSTKVESPGRDSVESSGISCKFHLLRLIKYSLVLG